MRRPARLLATAVAAAAPILGVAVPAAMTTSPAVASEQSVDSVRLNGFEAALATAGDVVMAAGTATPRIGAAAATAVASRRGRTSHGVCLRGFG